ASGDTVIIPAGTCTWTSGVTTAGKGLTVTGAGSGRVVAYSLDTLALTTGSKSLTIAPENVSGTMPTLGVGQTLRIIELGWLGNFLQGTVTSFNSSTGALVMNITSAGGTCPAAGPPNQMDSNCGRWMITTPATTTIINNTSAGSAMFSVSENTSTHANIS